MERGIRAKRLRSLLHYNGVVTYSWIAREKQINLALATSISTICRELDVDIVRSWNIGHSEYWGKLGHYKIATKACALLSNLKLSKPMNKNLDTISFDDDSIRQGELPKIDSKQFVPLADVPDFLAMHRKKDSGNHFADMDEEGHGQFEGTTLLQITRDPKNVSINVWNAFYDSLGVDYKRGALPFRVWQIYNDMVKFVSQGDVERFVCATGILSHYVGDACQPLHVSKLHHGRPGHPKEESVHSYYETNMMDQYPANLIAEVNDRLKNTTVKADVTGGHECAVSAIELMRNSIKELPPLDIIEAFNDTSSDSRISRMFMILGKRTASCIVKGCERLASIWESAWREGKGNKISDSKIISVKRQTLKQIYNDKLFLEPYRLSDERFLEVLS